MKYLKLIILSSIILLSSKIAHSSLLAGSYSVYEGETTTITIPTSFINTLNMSTVIGYYWTAGSSDISIISKSTTQCTIRGQRITDNARLNYKCSYKIDGFYREFDVYFDITVKQRTISIANVTISPSNTTLNIDETCQLKVNIYPSNASYKNITWSTNNNCVTVSNNGFVKAIKAGTAKVYCYVTESNGNVWDNYCTVTVSEPILIESINLSNNRLEIEEGETYALSATVVPDNANNKELKWSTDNTSVISIDSDGLIHALKPGVCNVICSTSDGSNLSSLCNVIVTEAKPKILVSELILDKTNIIVGLNETVRLNCEILPENASNKEIEWSSWHSDIATVCDGILEAQKVGTTVISATSTDGSNVSAFCSVKVVEDASINDIMIDNLNITYNNVYDLTGRIILTNATLKQVNSLKRGLYFYNGKKIFVR